MKLIGNGGIRPLEKERCKKWQLWQFVEIDGKRSQRTEVFHGGKREANKRFEQFRAELADVVPNSVTFRSYCDRWLEWAVDFGDYSPVSIKNYRAYLNAVCKVFGDLTMDAITLKTCKDGLFALKHGCNQSSKELSGATMVMYFKALKIVLDSAVDEGAISANPLDHVKRPKVDTEERPALSPSELDELWNKVRELPLDGRACALLCAIDTGMRRGELSNQKVADVGKVIVVSKSKTKAGTGRVLPLTDRLRDVIDEWRRDRLLYGISGSQWLFCDHDGSRVPPHALGMWATSRLNALGYDLTLHGVRHSNLSKMARYMGAHDLQRWAGWATITPAMRYVHDDFSQLEAAVKRSQITMAPRNVANMLYADELKEDTAV